MAYVLPSFVRLIPRHDPPPVDGRHSSAARGEKLPPEGSRGGGGNRHGAALLRLQRVTEEYGSLLEPPSPIRTAPSPPRSFVVAIAVTGEGGKGVRREKGFPHVRRAPGGASSRGD